MQGYEKSKDPRKGTMGEGTARFADKGDESIKVCLGNFV
jgi:hypothetical protein